MTSSSRVNKYKDLREGIKGEAGINRDTGNTTTTQEQEDDFLSFINRGVTSTNNVEDTLTEAKTFDQIRQESSKEIDDALKSVKSNVGKEEQYNTRLDILNKIRNSEKDVVPVNKVENISTEQFSKGHFVKEEEKPVVPIEVPEAPKKKMTLMERLASMSPKEDVKKVEEALQQEQEQEEVVVEEEKQTLSEPIPIEETNSLEEMVNMIKKRDQLEVEKALQQKQTVHEDKPKIEKKEKASSRLSRVEQTNEEKENKTVTITNYIIIALIVVCIVLCFMIVKQIFF